MLADDWKTPIRDKLDRLARINPEPARLIVDRSGNLLDVITGSGSATAPFAPPLRMPSQPLNLLPTPDQLPTVTPVEARALLRFSWSLITWNAWSFDDCNFSAMALWGVHTVHLRPTPSQPLQRS